MKRHLIALVLIAGILFTTAWAQTAKPQQWEYKFVGYGCNEKSANDLAVQGWELTSMSAISYSNVLSMACVFKRSK